MARQSFFFAVISWCLLVVVLALPGNAFSVSNRSSDSLSLGRFTFAHYVQRFGKTYNTESEQAMRKEVFDKNVAKIKAHNLGEHSFTMGVNDLTDLTDEEFKRMNGARPLMRRHVTPGLFEVQHVRRNFSSPPHQVDYRASVPPILTAVKNQGHCGSCWAHSAVEAMESHWAIATGALHVLSQQQLTACTPNPRHCGGTGGCFGSVEALAFEYVASAGGLAEEWAYPYTAFYGNSGECKPPRNFPVARVAGFASVPKNDQDALLDAVASIGPMAVSVDASRWSAYSGGIFDGCDYAQNITMNHAVQLVGYGHDFGTGQDYWIIRNSWGPRWGENGYMRLLRESKPTCGWSVNTHEGSACDGDPDEEWACGMCGILSGVTYPIMNYSGYFH